jgi:polysaccharide pyruvyl transferase WcaK-like protein
VVLPQFLRAQIDHLVSRLGIRTDRRLRVGLLSPYTGGNLGDAAIQSAVIENLRQRVPKLSLFGLTLSPVATEEIHGIRCYPLTLISRPYYALDPGRGAAKADTQDVPEPNAGWAARLRQYVKARKTLYPILRIAKNHLLVSAGFLRNIASDIAHTVSAIRTCLATDVLVVSGGGQLDDYWGGAWGHPFTLFKWALLARLTRTKFVMLSVGACSTESRTTRAFLSWALKLSHLRSYRDAGTKALLRGWDFTRNDPVVPDLAFSYPVPSVAPIGKSRSVGQRRIGISPISHLSPHYWPQTNGTIFDNYVSALTEFASTQLSNGDELVFFTTASPDVHVASQLTEKLMARIGSANQRVRIERFSANNLDALFQVLSGLDLVIASRLHGVILSHLVAVPVLAISYDRKVDVHMEDLGQGRFCLDFHTLAVPTLLARFARLAGEAAEIRELLKTNVAIRRAVLADVYDRLVREFTGTAG